MLPADLKQFPVAAALEARDSGAILDAATDRGELTLRVAPEKLVEVCRFLKAEQKFARLSDVTAVDRGPAEPRFEVVYHLHSLERNQRLRLKCRLGEPAEIESLTTVWPAADWYEREVWDLFGIRFRNHPDPRRILLPDDFTEHPLRKDYPIHGRRYDYA